ncbi:MAG TPA: hypothetical protein VL985_20010 [Stellaceae bacterium]|nr:hypothetical protein [Stellaceae bacterium]
MSRARVARGIALLSLLVLSDCSSLPFSASKPIQACPAAVILRPLANTAVFGPGVVGEPRPDNVAFYGLLSEVDRSCEYSDDTVQVTLDVIVIGQRAPAAKGDSVAMTYFVAVTAPGQQIISKKPFSVNIVFDPDQIRAGVTDHIVETIPLGGRHGSEITLLLGFQQTREVVDFYQHFRGR